MLGVRLIILCILAALVCGIAGILRDKSKALAVVVTAISGGVGLLWWFLLADLPGC